MRCFKKGRSFICATEPSFGKNNYHIKHTVSQCAIIFRAEISTRFHSHWKKFTMFQYRTGIPIRFAVTVPEKYNYPRHLDWQYLNNLPQQLIDKLHGREQVTAGNLWKTLRVRELIIDIRDRLNERRTDYTQLAALINYKTDGLTKEEQHFKRTRWRRAKIPASDFAPYAPALGKENYY